MKGHEATRLDALRMLKTALMKYKVDTMKELDEQSELQILNMLVKQRRESADMFRKGNRPELADKEEAELKLIESYLPAGATDEEVDAALTAAIAETDRAWVKMSKRSRLILVTTNIINIYTQNIFAKLSVARTAPPRQTGDNTEAKNKCPINKRNKTTSRGNRWRICPMDNAKAKIAMAIVIFPNGTCERPGIQSSGRAK